MSIATQPFSSFKNAVQSPNLGQYYGRASVSSSSAPRYIPEDTFTPLHGSPSQVSLLYGEGNDTVEPKPQKAKPVEINRDGTRIDVTLDQLRALQAKQQEEYAETGEVNVKFAPGSQGHEYRNP
jgi:hypothetical protein